jgi:endonuclease YncB( thermonuclease family)
MATSRHYPLARVVEVHDADTVRFDVDCGFSVHAYVWVRLRGVRAPELREPDGMAARNDTVVWLAEHAPTSLVALETFQTEGSGALKEIHERRTFVRYVGVVTADNGAELNKYLIDLGFVSRGE